MKMSCPFPMQASFSSPTRATVRRIANLAIVVFSTVGIGAGAYAVVMW